MGVQRLGRLRSTTAMGLVVGVVAAGAGLQAASPAEAASGLTRGCTIRSWPCSFGLFKCLVLPLGAAVGHDSRDGEDGVLEVFPASNVALQGSPLFGFRDRVFDADPL